MTPQEEIKQLKQTVKELREIIRKLEKEGARPDAR